MRKVQSRILKSNCCAILVGMPMLIGAREGVVPHHNRRVDGADDVDYYFYCWKS